jgi:hypothetical protein
VFLQTEHSVFNIPKQRIQSLWHGWHSFPVKANVATQSEHWLAAGPKQSIQFAEQQKVGAPAAAKVDGVRQVKH